MKLNAHSEEIIAREPNFTYSRLLNDEYANTIAIPIKINKEGCENQIATAPITPKRMICGIVSLSLLLMYIATTYKSNAITTSVEYCFTSDE